MDPTKDAEAQLSQIKRTQIAAQSGVNPRDAILAAKEMPPVVPSVSVANRTILADDVIYHVVQAATDMDVNGAPVAGGFDKTFNVSGDHVYCAEIVGDSLYIRLGPDSNPWIRLEDQMVLTRKFDKLRIRSSAGGTPPRPAGSALLYISTGPLIEVPHRHRDGLSSTYLGVDSVADTTNVSLSNFIASAVGNTGPWPMIGKVGGSLIIRNTDLANTLLVSFAHESVGTPLALYPGEIFTGTLDQKLNLNLSSTGGGWALYPKFRCAAGTCLFYVAVTPSDYDSFDLRLGSQPGSITG